MPKSWMNPKVDAYLARDERWREETAKLRAIILPFGMDEELKWGQPCYSFQESNLLILQGFKEYCALMFCKGALLKDSKGILKTPGKHQAVRQIRFTSVREIAGMEPVVKAYIHEAMEAQKAGLEVQYKETSDFAVPEELQRKFEEFPDLKTAFDALTPGRQRGYLLHFAAPKQSKTRESRIEKCMEQIFDGKGWNDEYLAKRKAS